MALKFGLKLEWVTGGFKYFFWLDTLINALTYGNNIILNISLFDLGDV